MISVLNSFDTITTALAVSLLLCAVWGSSKFRQGQIVRYFALQSIFLALLLGSLAFHGDQHLYLNAVCVLLFKAMLIPAIITSSAKRSYTSGRLISLVSSARSYCVSGVALVVAVMAARAIAPAIADVNLILICLAFAIMLIGSAMMMVRRDAYSQIIAFFTLGNGVTLLATATLGAIPILAELGIDLTVTLGVLLMSLLARRLKELYAVEDTGELRELIG